MALLLPAYSSRVRTPLGMLGEEMAFQKDGPLKSNNEKSLKAAIFHSDIARFLKKSILAYLDS